MKVHAIGAKRMSGKSSKTGAEYDFANLTVLVPIEPVSNGKLTINGFGFQVSDLELDKTRITDFSKFPFPCDLVLQVEQRVDRNGLKTVVIGAQTLDQARNIKAA